MRTTLLTALLTLCPSAADAQEKQDTLYGKASYYSLRMTGRKTANGERFHNDSMMCAHRDLPFGTLLRVRNLDNGKEVILRVNDRGPYAKKYILDITQRAARELGFLRKGWAEVEVVVLPKDAIFPIDTPPYSILEDIKEGGQHDTLFYEPQWQADSLPHNIPAKNAGIVHKRKPKHKHKHHRPKKAVKKTAKKPASQQARKSTSQQANKATSQQGNKPANQQASKATSQQGNKPANQQASKSTSQQGNKSTSQQAKKTTSQQGNKTATKK